MTQRSMIVRHKGKQSKEYPLPGGSPQGCLIGVLSFLVEISDCGMDIPHQPDLNTNEDVISRSHPQPAVTNVEIRQKYDNSASNEGLYIKIKTDNLVSVT